MEDFDRKKPVDFRTKHTKKKNGDKNMEQSIYLRVSSLKSPQSKINIEIECENASRANIDIFQK